MEDYLKLFKQYSEYSAYTSNVSEMDRPRVCYCRPGRLVSYFPYVVDILCEDTITAESYKLSALVQGHIKQNITFALVKGDEYASMAPNGQLTINYNANNSPIEITAAWGVSKTTKKINVTYLGGASVDTDTEIIDNPDGTTTEQTTTVVTNPDGTSAKTTNESTYSENGNVVSTSASTESTDASGNTSATTNTAIYSDDGTIAVETSSSSVTNSDGSGSYSGTTVNYDENGNVESSTDQTINREADGSSSSTTINYDGNGDPTDKTNQNTDTSGNVNTQEIEYDENGDEVVTGYDVDTSGNPQGSKNYNNDGVNTEFYALDVTQGFIMDIHFTIDFTQQPPNQNDGHHNIINSKRATPEPWYGFQIRHSSTNKYIQLGTQYSTGSNLNQTIATTNANKYNGSANIYEYNIHIVYDPTASDNKFSCDELIGDAFHYTENKTFPDIEDLKYIKTTVGCALDSNGEPFRFSNINVFSFSITKLNSVATPSISCDGQQITMACTTEGATIYYKLNSIGSYVAYTSPVSITADTTVQAYAELNGKKSSTITETCIYVSNIETPVITCAENLVSITCETTGTTIYYRVNKTGDYVVYTENVPITADTVFQAYAQSGTDRSAIAEQTCLYDNGIKDPSIYCDGEFVTIDSDTPSVDIYYRLNRTGEFAIYTEAIELTADTFVEAYAELNGERSHTTSMNCTYSPIILIPPVILCNGQYVTISCETSDADIYYKLNQEGSFVIYSEPIEITADTFVQAYSRKGGHTSEVVSENCQYDPVHDYSRDYLTFRIKSAGKIYWRSNGSHVKTIEYSLNNGAWTTITAASTPPTITVVADDVVRFRGTNAFYGTSKSAYAGFGQGEAGASGQETYDADGAILDIEGNIMSLIYGDNFIGQTTFSGGTYNFCSMFKKLKVVSAEHLVLPATTLREGCYRAMFSWCTYLEKAPELPATTLAQYCYWYMFEKCAITTAPDLLFETFVNYSCGSMFTGCASLNFIKCMAINGFSATQCKQSWTTGVASSGTFVKDSGVSTSTWSRGANGIPTSWLVYDDVPVTPPTITYDGFSIITLSCETQGATIYYKLNNAENYSAYTTAITITADTVINAYSELNGQDSRVITQTCPYTSDVPIEASNRDLKKWNYSGNEVTTPYSINAIDGHSSSYSKGTFNFTTSFALREGQPAHLWFQHADHSATIYVDDTLVEKHWGGYTAFAVDISNYVHSGTNNIKVAIKNNEGNYVAPAAGDFNFNATLGNVKLFTSPVLPAINYGYDGFHVSSTVSQASATINVKTTIPTGATVVCTIDDGNTNIYSASSASTVEEMVFTTTIANPHLWNGKSDPYLYDITLEIYYNNELYHRFVRPYGLRYYEYVINDITKVGTESNPYTGFLLNGSPYLLRGCCMHDDIAGKANALDETDYNNTFATIQELGLNFLRLAHYPHPKEVYDRCDRLGIVVQTEGPCVNKMQSTMPADYYTHLETQYSDMVNQHYNHPCIFFWGLSNETTTDDKAFAKEKIEGYTTLIKNLDSGRMVGYVLAQGTGASPSAYYNDPAVDWFGCNIYVGWYDSPNSNTPTSQINTRLANTINRVGKPMAYSEYGCGGTQRCHSDDFMTTTTRGNKERHDIEYMMWLHEGHIATIKQYPQLMFTSQWQLFDIAVANRNEGYTVCLDGETTSIDDELRRLNDKGLVERDHVTKKDPFYLYKAWWNPTPFVHICGQNYTKKTDRVIKCYTNQTGTFTLYVNNTSVATATPTDNILEFTSHTFSAGDVVRVDGPSSVTDTFTFATT